MLTNRYGRVDMETVKKEKVNSEQAIMAAAEELFMEHGYNLTTTTMIARQAGVTHAMLHYYFRTKEHIFIKVLDKNLNEMMSAFQPVMKKGAPFWESMESGISTYFDFCLFNRCSFTAIDGRYSVFSGSTFINCSINDSMIIHSNFMGIETDSCDFSGNDFYYSNFSLSKLMNTSIEDCNLKRTSFRSSITKNVSFRFSNPEEAYFRKED